MSEPLDAYVVIEGNKLDIQRVYLAADHIAALAAKDARIAELEGLLREVCDAGYSMGLKRRIDVSLAGQQQAEPCEDMAEQLERAEIRMMFGDAQEPATHSEDGREAVRVVGHLNSDPDTPDFGMWLSDMPQGQSSALPLMTVAQHSRIVAAKDAEIAQLREQSDRYCELWNRAGNRLAAQPARQVGGEQRSAGDAWLWHALRSQYGDESQAEEGFYAGWKARAALAPAAVVKKYKWDEIVGLVGEVLGCEYQRDPAFFIGHQMPGINFNSLSRIIDRVQHREVARLNRRAIPEGLLERIAKMPSSPEAEMDRYEACDELRSLLSQQQEGGV